MQISGSSFLVTGGSGFIGSHVVDRLVAEGADVVVFDKRVREENLADALPSGRVRTLEGDVTEPAAVRQAAEGVAGVFHMAVLPLGPCSEDPRRCVEVNVDGTLNVLEAAREAGAKKVVFSSASSVYGDTNETMDESHPLGARTMYGASKIAGEYFVRAFSDLYGIDHVILRYMNVYGPGQRAGVVPAVARALLAGDAPSLTGDGSQAFDFVHIDDCARANTLALVAGASGAALNVGSGDAASLNEVVATMSDLLGVDIEPAHQGQPSTAPPRVGDVAGARRLIAYEAQVSLREGLASVLDELQHSTAVASGG